MKVKLGTILELFRSNTIDEQETVTISTYVPDDKDSEADDTLEIVIGFAWGFPNEKADSVYDDLVNMFDNISVDTATDSIFSNDGGIEIYMPNFIAEMPDIVYDFLKSSGIFSREAYIDDVFGDKHALFKLKEFDELGEYYDD